MKRKFSKILGVGLTLALLISLLMIAAPVSAEEPAIRLTAAGDPGTTDTIVVEVPSGTTLGDIESIAWEALLVSGYAVHVDIMLNMDGDPEADDALVVEYAYNHPGATRTGEGPDSVWGCEVGAWYSAFENDPAAITTASGAWLTSQASGGATMSAGETYGELDAGFYFATISDWLGGNYILGIGADTPVTHLEIEIDNWIMNTEALVSGIVVAIAGADEDVVEMTASSPGEIIGISVAPSVANFGSLVPGDDSDAVLITVTNTGNVAVDIDATVIDESVTDFYATNLTMAVPSVAGSVSAWAASNVPPESGNTVVPELVLSMPAGTPAGTYTATLVFWAELAE